MVTWIIVGIVVLIVIWLLAVYNGLITKRNRVEEAWSDIDVQLKRRHDLIPNLVETVKGYMTHEKELFEKVTEARAAAVNAQGVKEEAEAENALSGTLRSLFAVAENYPQLRATENFQKLQDELTDTEDKIEAARRFYNGNVRDYNISIERVPASLVAGMFGFGRKDLFEVANAEEKEAPEVKFGGEKA